MFAAGTTALWQQALFAGFSQLTLILGIQQWCVAFGFGIYIDEGADDNEALEMHPSKYCL